MEMEPSPAAPPDPALSGRRRRRRRLAAGVLAALAVGLVVDATLIEPRWIEVTRHDVPGSTGPRELVLVHLTDVHMRTRGPREARVLELLDEVRPDLVLLTGDLLLAGFDRAEVAAWLAEVRRRARLGAYACVGNHEDWNPGSFACYADGGVELLLDQRRVLLDGRLELLGLASAQSPLPPPAGEAYRLALCHYPAVLPRAAEAGIDLVLAGHTHGGQLRLPLYGPLWLPFDSGPYVAGWFEEGETAMYVSRGVGMSVLPIRFLCRPEVAVHRLRLPDQ